MYRRFWERIAGEYSLETSIDGRSDHRAAQNFIWGKGPFALGIWWFLKSGLLTYNKDSKQDNYQTLERRMHDAKRLWRCQTGYDGGD